MHEFVCWPKDFVSAVKLTDRSSFSMFILKVLFQKSIRCSLEILPLMQLKMN